MSPESNAVQIHIAIFAIYIIMRYTMTRKLYLLGLGLLAAVLMPTVSIAQNPGVLMEINSKTGVYAVGDSIKVWATILPECQNAQEFAIHENMFKYTKKEKLQLQAGRHLVHAGVCEKPAHYVFSVGEAGAKPGSKEISVVGAIVEPESMKSGYDAPKDLAKFWKKEIAKMRKMPLKAELKPAPKEKRSHDGFKCYDIEIPMPEGNPVRAYLVIPENAAPKSLPILIRAHSAGVKGKWCQSSIDQTIDDAKRGNGCIALDINAHGMLNGQPQSYYDALDAGELNLYSSRECTGHETFYFRLMYLRLVRALDYLVTLPEWDGKRVAIYGESQGGAQTAALAGMDPRVTAAVLRVPAFIDVAGKLQDRRGSWPGAYGKDPESLKDVIPYYDGACLLTLTKAKLFFEAGLVDYTCPPGCVAAGYNNALSKDKTIVFFPYRPHTTGKMDKRFEKRWKEEIMAPREQWLNDYLK